MIERSGSEASQSTGSSPRLLAIQANRPFTGCISMFFQTSPETVGMTKKGEIAITRTMPRPKKGWSSSSASSVPNTSVIRRTPPTSSSVLTSAPKKAGSSRKYP